MIKVSVPVNITLKWELWRGFQKADLLRTVAVTSVGIGCAIVYGLLSQQEARGVIAMVSLVFLVAICVGLFTRMENNQSIYTYYKMRMDFHRKQQSFTYQKQHEEVIYATQRKN